MSRIAMHGKALSFRGTAAALPEGFPDEDYLFQRTWQRVLPTT